VPKRNRFSWGTTTNE